jgi:hypothetical protein
VVSLFKSDHFVFKIVSTLNLKENSILSFRILVEQMEKSGNAETFISKELISMMTKAAKAETKQK